MKKYILFGGYLLLLAYITSCDDGRIYEKTETLSEEGRTLKMSGKINGISKWPDGYSVVVAGFSDESEYAVVTKTIPAVEDDEIQVTMTGVSDKVTTIELCVINKLRKRVISFQSMDDLTAVDDTILMDVGTVNVGMYHGIQEKVFNTTCAHCHGGGFGSSQPVSDRRQKLRGTGQPPVEESRWHVTRQAGQCARKRIAHIIEYHY